MPLVPDSIIIQEALLIAVHAQPLWVETATEPVAADALSILLVGENNTGACGRRWW